MDSFEEMALIFLLLWLVSSDRSSVTPVSTYKNILAKKRRIEELHLDLLRAHAEQLTLLSRSELSKVAGASTTEGDAS
jgi:hypothetical protein